MILVRVRQLSHVCCFKTCRYRRPSPIPRQSLVRLRPCIPASRWRGRHFWDYHCSISPPLHYSVTCCHSSRPVSLGQLCLMGGCRRRLWKPAQKRNPKATNDETLCEAHHRRGSHIVDTPTPASVAVKKDEVRRNARMRTTVLAVVLTHSPLTTRSRKKREANTTIIECCRCGDKKRSTTILQEQGAQKVVLTLFTRKAQHDSRLHVRWFRQR